MWYRIRSVRSIWMLSHPFILLQSVNFSKYVLNPQYFSSWMISNDRRRVWGIVGQLSYCLHGLVVCPLINILIWGNQKINLIMPRVLNLQLSFSLLLHHKLNFQFKKKGMLWKILMQQHFFSFPLPSQSSSFCAHFNLHPSLQNQSQEFLYISSSFLY